LNQTLNASHNKAADPNKTAVPIVTIEAPELGVGAGFGLLQPVPIGDAQISIS